MSSDTPESAGDRVDPVAMMAGLSVNYFVLPGEKSYLSEIDFTAAPHATGVVGALDRATDDTPFWAGGPTDAFAARYTGALVIETAGQYTFRLTSDDGSALYLNGTQVIDNDGLHAAATRQVTLDLEVGIHSLQLLYFERGGVQTLKLEWQGPDTGDLLRVLTDDTLVHDPRQPAATDPVAFAEPGTGNTGLKAAYFNLPTGVSNLSQVDFTATPDATAVVGALDMMKSDTPFWADGPKDNFAARYDGALVVETAGRYTLYLTSDDGSALYLDGERVIDNDGLHAATTRQVTLDLSAGRHALEVLYFERTSAQTLQLEWRGPDTGDARQTIDGASLEHEAAPVVPVEAPVDPVTPAPQFQVSGAGYDLVEFAADAQGTGPAEIGTDGRSVTMTGDDWKAVEGTFEITADTVLRFTYASDVEGEIHGIGFANADATVDLMPERGGSGALFQIGGVTRGWGIENTAWDYAFGSGETTFEIAVGKYLEGTFDRMVFAMDDDAGRGSSATFADVELVTSADEAPTEPAAQFQVSGAGYDLIEFAADAQGTGPAEIGTDGRSVTMTGDDWKAVEGTFEITADTVLRFTYASDVEGEIHGIGFANADATVDLMPERGGSGALFQLGGVTRGWGIENTAWDYAFGSGETTFEIAVGKYLEGTFDRMVFAMDDDAGRGSSATFADVEFGVKAPELDPEPRNTAPDAIDDTFSTGHGDPLVLSAADLLTNDSDADGDALTVTGVTAVTGGTATRTGDAILFTPDAGFEGTATFAYSVSDGAAVSIATVSVQVAPPDSSPSGYAGSLLTAISEGVGLADPSLAVGLDSFSYWKSPPFLNLMKQAAMRGIVNSAGDRVTLDELVVGGYLDENGYPVRMYEGNETLLGRQQGYDITVSIHHQNEFVRQETSGDYVVEWSGAGDIALRGFDVTAQQTFHAADGTVTGGRMTGTWGHEDALKMVKIRDTDPDGTGNYIRDISIVRAEYKDMYDAGAIFDPRYTAQIEDHHTLRFMDWMRTNGSDVKSLADVASSDSLTWAGGVNANSSPEVDSTGVLPLSAQIPFEVMVQLANEVGADPWFNIPLKADDEYVRALAAYVEDNLDDGLVAKFELSNEVWNWAGGFEQVREASLLGSNGSTSTSIRDARDYYGYRSAEIREILDAEMSRVDAELILGTQTVYYAIAEMVEDGVSRYFADKGITGRMSDVFDALAVTGYFSGVNRDEFVELRQFWYTDSEVAFAAGNTATKHDVFVARAADYLANGIDALTPEELALVARQSDGNISTRLIDPLEGFLRNNFAENKRMADQWGLELIQYEADSHIAPKNYRNDPESEWYKALNKSPEMGQLTAHMAEIFREEGGTLVNDFGHLGDSSYGLWGTRAHMADENPISEAYDTYNATAAAEFGSINTGRDPSAFLHGVTENGTAGADTLIGTAQRDYLTGGDGNDLLVGGPGNDGLHGGAGIDMVLFDGNRDEFAFRTDGDMLIVSGPTGEDRLVDVELLAFAGSREFVRASDLTDDAPIADLADLLAQFDTEHGVLTHFF